MGAGYRLGRETSFELLSFSLSSIRQINDQLFAVVHHSFDGVS